MSSSHASKNLAVSRETVVGVQGSLAPAVGLVFQAVRGDHHEDEVGQVKVLLPLGPVGVQGALLLVVPFGSWGQQPSGQGAPDLAWRVLRRHVAQGVERVGWYPEGF